jgi:ssDNA-binding Zn-finger/Zn-ribbon topoisomerase 1
VADWTGKHLSYEEARASAPVLPCPQCKGLLSLRQSRFGMFYGCDNYPKCTATHGAHPDGQPLGTPADGATKRARIEAHAEFDRLWKETGLKRKQAYGWLRKHCPGLPAHISEMNAEQCRELVERVRAHLGTSAKGAKQ